MTTALDASYPPSRHTGRTGCVTPTRSPPTTGGATTTPGAPSEAERGGPQTMKYLFKMTFVHPTRNRAIGFVVMADDEEQAENLVRLNQALDEWVTGGVVHIAGSMTTCNPSPSHLDAECESCGDIYWGHHTARMHEIEDEDTGEEKLLCERCAEEEAIWRM